MPESWVSYHSSYLVVSETRLDGASAFASPLSETMQSSTWVGHLEKEKINPCTAAARSLLCLCCMLPKRFREW